MANRVLEFPLPLHLPILNLHYYSLFRIRWRKRHDRQGHSQLSSDLRLSSSILPIPECGSHIIVDTWNESTSVSRWLVHRVLCNTRPIRQRSSIFTRSYSIRNNSPKLAALQRERNQNA